MTVTARPVSHIATGRDPPKRVLSFYLGGHRSRCSVSETEVEEFASVGIYRVCASFYVADALRPAIQKQPVPSKPVIPKSKQHQYNSTYVQGCKECQDTFAYTALV